jgi:hypothetical protein
MGAAVAFGYHRPILLSLAPSTSTTFIVSSLFGMVR